jgi:4,5-dihydroxyphthalate decarboxylase
MAEIEAEFVAGSIQAMFVSRLPGPVREGHPSVARLFDDPQAEEERYLKEEGYFPIMHVLAYKQELAQEHSDLPQALFDIFERARKQAMRRWIDPNWSMVMWGRQALERQNQLCDFDPWRNGLEANRKNLERFSLYSYEQGLTGRRLGAAELFVPIN